MKYVLEVNEQDEIIGPQEKLYAHQKGILHRAFSIFTFNSKWELLLQQRATEKYHCGGLWTNTCCSHPASANDTITDAHKRLQEEMGFDCELSFIEKFLYKAELDNGLREHELDYIYKGYYDGPVNFNQAEVQAIRYISWSDLQTELKEKPEQFTPWLKLICEAVNIV
jgi:isopentenyl-diphosphate delta-isomerase